MPLERSPHAPFTLWQVGVPMDPKGHDLTKKSQSAKDTLHERQLATMLQEEVDQFGDINVLPMRDQYQDLTNKFLGVAQYAFFRTSAKVQYVLWWGGAAWVDTVDSGGGGRGEQLKGLTCKGAQPRRACKRRDACTFSSFYVVTTMSSTVSLCTWQPHEFNLCEQRNTLVFMVGRRILPRTQWEGLDEKERCPWQRVVHGCASTLHELARFRRPMWSFRSPP